MKQPRIACVYDWFDSWGGAERVLEAIHELYPHADWYTSWVHPSARWAHAFQPIRTSFIQNLPLISRSRLLTMPLYPYAFESFDFSDYDIVISITSSFAKGIITKPQTKHICYMLTPTRFLWEQSDTYVSGIGRWLAQPYMNYLREWDWLAGQRPDEIIAISQTVADRIQSTYGRSAQVIYPPLDRAYWEEALRHAQAPDLPFPQSFYLLVSRFKPYKKIDQVIDAFNSMPDKHLIIVGDGSALTSAQLKIQAGRNITFMKKLTDEQLAYMYGYAQALIMPQEEDFGYTSLEAQLCGCAVIAYNKGGATETVTHGVTGLLYDDQSATGIIEAVEKHAQQAYTVERYLQAGGINELEKFERKSFEKKFSKAVGI